MIGIDEATIVAFNLPQFHRMPENDAWWGEGFTEWTNVRRAEPQFPGHGHPQVPGELGYYDLTDPETQAAQQALARRHGVGAFCHYVYWFGGRRLLERPLQVIRDHPELDLPYFFCWANEPWTRRWDGMESDVLQAQHHDAAGDADIVDDLAEHLTDERYLRIDGKPVLLIYRASILDGAGRTVEALRRRAAGLGIGELYLGVVQSFGYWDPREDGFDAAVEFPPHDLFGDPRVQLPPHHPAQAHVAQRFDWTGRLDSYPMTVEAAMSRPVPDFTWFRGVMPAWDNTPRRGAAATVFVDSSPQAFQGWLERALHYAYLFNAPGERLVFVNAWNEWGEGAYLEPDEANGLARLEAVAAARAATLALADPSGAALREIAQAYFAATADLTRLVLKG